MGFSLFSGRTFNSDMSKYKNCHICKLGTGYVCDKLVNTDSRTGEQK